MSVATPVATWTRGVTVIPTRPRVAELERLGDEIAELSAHLDAATARLLALIGEFASRTVMSHDDAGHIVEVAARNRTIPPALRRALQARDHGCRFPGCGSRFTEGHHIRHWARGGPTTLSNLALLCRRHHRAVHEEGFQIARGPDDALRRPAGELLLEAPDPPALGANPVALLRARHAAAGLRITARTGLPFWLGGAAGSRLGDRRAAAANGAFDGRLRRFRGNVGRGGLLTGGDQRSARRAYTNRLPQSRHWRSDLISPSATWNLPKSLIISARQ